MSKDPQEVHIHYHYPKVKGDRIAVQKKKATKKSYKKEVKVIIKVAEELLKLV